MLHPHSHVLASQKNVDRRNLPQKDATFNMMIDDVKMTQEAAEIQA